MRQLLDMIVLWTNLEEPDRVAGHGQVVAVDGRLILVQVLQDADDAEPPFQRVFDLSDQTLMFFHDLDEREVWMAWLRNLRANRSDG